MKNNTLARIGLTTLALAIAPAQQVLAQQLVLEEVIVTAQKREQSLQDVPIAVAAMSGEKINDVGIQDLEELTLYLARNRMAAMGALVLTAILILVLITPLMPLNDPDVTATADRFERPFTDGVDHVE